MAINIDGLTAAGALDPNDLMELQQSGVNKKLELSALWGLCKGFNTLSIYKSATTTTTIKPGNIHINDGTDNYMLESTTFSNITISGATGWSFITATPALLFTQRAAAGAVTDRPTSTCYSYVDGANTGFNHLKAGYYYSEDERIIGAVYWSGSAILYVINNGSGSDEIGENSRGGWKRENKNQKCYYRLQANGASAITWTYPVAFVGGPNSDNIPILTHGIVRGASGVIVGFTSVAGATYLTSAEIDQFSDAGARIGYHENITAEGYWHL
jgi:hypothetical protein